MTRRLFPLLSLALLLAIPATAKDKKKAQLPDYVLRAETVRVVIDPDAAVPIDQPNLNRDARDAVEQALTDWGRFKVVYEPHDQPDLVIVIRAGDDRLARPMIRGGSDDSIRIGQRSQAPPFGNDPTNSPQDHGPRITNEVGPTTDSFEVYQGRGSDPVTNSAPAWRYMAKDCLREPDVTAVEQFRKAIADTEKSKPAKKP